MTVDAVGNVLNNSDCFFLVFLRFSGPEDIWSRVTEISRKPKLAFLCPHNSALRVFRSIFNGQLLLILISREF